MDSLLNGLIIIGIILGVLGIIALLYGIIAIRRRGIMISKMDYLIEDITYKSELLNSTVETVSKLSNYVDIFDVVARKNIKSLAQLIARNKEDIYKILDRLKLLAMGEAETRGAKAKAKVKKAANKIKKKIKKAEEYNESHAEESKTQNKTDELDIDEFKVTKGTGEKKKKSGLFSRIRGDK